MQRIAEDIKKGSFSSVYLLFGKENYLKRKYRNALKKALIPEGDTMNHRTYENGDVPVKELIDLAETMPFFAQYRVILINDSGLFKKGGEELAEYIPSVPESTILIFTEQEIDKRSRLYKAVADKGHVAEFAEQDENTLRKWILGELRKENKNITEQTMSCLMEKTGGDMENIEMELRKLFAYTMGKEVVTTQDVEAVCVTRTETQVFDMIDAIADRNQKRALELYYDLLAQKEPPMKILFWICRQFNILLQVKELRSQGFDKYKIADKTGQKPFFVGKYMSQAAKFEMAELKEAVREGVSLEEDVKTGKMDDRMSVEILIVKYSRGQSRGGQDASRRR